MTGYATSATSQCLHYHKAIELLQEVVRQEPGVAAPYHTLGLIYEDMKDPKKALEFYMIAAHLTPKDLLQWKRLAQMSRYAPEPQCAPTLVLIAFREQKNPHQALYCLGKAIRLDPEDHDSVWDRCVLFTEVGEYKKAIDGLLVLTEARPGDADVIKELAKVCDCFLNKRTNISRCIIWRDTLKRPSHFWKVLLQNQKRQIQTW